MTDSNNSNSSPETPKLCVDALVDMGAGMIALIKRKNDPQGWALPGGYVDLGESVEESVIREVKEETGLSIELVRQFHVYSDPKRDPRGSTASVVFLVKSLSNKLKANSDAVEAKAYHQMNLPEDICFDHRMIIDDYFNSRY